MCANILYLRVKSGISQLFGRSNDLHSKPQYVEDRLNNVFDPIQKITNPKDCSYSNTRSTFFLTIFYSSQINRVSVQGVKSLGGHFACLCRGFEFYEVKKKFFCYYFSKRKWKYFYTFYHFYSEKSSKRAK